jgi:hypothetical protein
LPRNGSANTPVARQHLRNTQQRSNWEAVFSPCGPCYSYVMQQKNCWDTCFLCCPCRGYIRSRLWVSSAVANQLVQLRSCSWKVPAS